MRLALIATLVLGLARAPFQCASEPDPNRRMEDTAPEALWNLSLRFQDRGEERARIETLEQIVHQYPSSRYAQRAKLELGRQDAESGGEEAQAVGGESHGAAAADAGAR